MGKRILLVLSVLIIVIGLFCFKFLGEKRGKMTGKIAELDIEKIVNLDSLPMAEVTEKHLFQDSPLIVYIPEMHYQPYKAKWNIQDLADIMIFGRLDTTNKDLVNLLLAMKIQYQIFWTLREFIENYGLRLLCSEGGDGLMSFGKSIIALFDKKKADYVHIKGEEFAKLSFHEREFLIDEYMTRKDIMAYQASILICCLYGSQIKEYGVDNRKLVEKESNARRLKVKDSTYSSLFDSLFIVRSRMFVDKTIKVLRETRSPATILISGAEHQKEIVKYCKTKNVSIIVVKPSYLYGELLFGQ